MSPKFRGRQAIFIGTPPDDWGPSSLWSVPPSLDSVVCYQKNLSMPEAIHFCRVFNENERNKSRGQRQWAIVSRHLKAKRPGEHPDARQKRIEQRNEEIREQIRQEVLAELQATEGGAA